MLDRLTHSTLRTRIRLSTETALQHTVGYWTNRPTCAVALSAVHYSPRLRRCVVKTTLIIYIPMHCACAIAICTAQ